jgi:hypothetical protein
MAVMLDDGRAVAFDLKDYAQVDHGYAATIHKAQGVTVDCTHVLATPGLDRHAAYVALSRHRNSVELHYGRDDFADHARLVRTLSRERVKDMASDYTRDFAGRREIRVSAELAKRVAQAVARDPFDEFGNSIATRSPAQAPDPFAELTIPKAERPSLEQDASRKLTIAVERFARAATDVARLHTSGREPLPHQKEALRRAGNALNEIRPHGWRDIAMAFNRERSLMEDAAQGRTAAVRAMVLESELRMSPEKRAERFMGDWRKLAREREVHGFNADEASVRRAEAGMTAMGKQLQRDPQLESLLRPRARELGIGGGSGGSLSHSIQEWLDRSRRRDIGL